MGEKRPTLRPGRLRALEAGLREKFPGCEINKVAIAEPNKVAVVVDDKEVWQCDSSQKAILKNATVQEAVAAVTASMGGDCCLCCAHEHACKVM